MSTSIIILTCNKLEYTKQCIESIRKHTDKKEYELIIVDNKSTDGTVEWLKTQSDVKCIFNSENQGFPKGCNQGIRNSKKENDILLLNNDVIVTKNWLTNLKRCLYSNENIGAVGPLTNSAAYYQSIEVPYKNLKELEAFASDFNISNPLEWEERQKLIGFCMLIKRDILDEIGYLDERFTPGNYEDDDYCIRIINGGFKILLCKDTFIHHYGGVSFVRNEEYKTLLTKNEELFKKKWNFISRDNMSIYRRYEELIKGKNLNILELFCGTGATALYLKQKFNCTYYGFENNIDASILSKRVLNPLNIIELKNNKIIFDYLIISDIEKFLSLDYIQLLTSTLFQKMCNLIINIPININYEEELDLYIKRINSIVGNETIVFCDGIKEVDSISGKVTRAYLIYENRMYNILVDSISNINKNMHLDEAFNNMLNILSNNQVSLEYIIYIINKYCIDKINVLNTFGALCYENGLSEAVTIFEKALQYDDENYSLLMNYSEILHNIGEYEIALRNIKKIKNKDKSFKELYNKILYKRDLLRNFKFLLRRIEFNIEEEEAEKEIIKFIKEEKINENEIFKIIDYDIINKIYILNYIAIKCFENELYDLIIPLLQKAISLEPKDLDTNYNLAYVLNVFGEKEMALEYLNSLDIVNDNIKELKNIIIGEENVTR